MNINVTERDTFFICGCFVETTPQQNDSDISALYDDFFSNKKEDILTALHGNQKGYYGLSWYTRAHEQYCYLLGMKIGPDNIIPQNYTLKEIVKTTYAVASFPKGEDIIKAWTDFFYTEIPKAGLKVNEDYNLYFEYYPDHVQGEFELWVPVVKL